MITVSILIMLMFLFSTPLYALEDGSIGGDDTMIVFEADQRPDDFDKLIELPERAVGPGRTIVLPENASQTGLEKSERGLDRANQARERSREIGLERAREASDGRVEEQIRERDSQTIRPGKPEVPGRPQLPIETPEKPVTPEKPELPETPNKPELPEVPDRTEKPEAPGKPEIPGTPDRPERPNID